MNSEDIQKKELCNVFLDLMNSPDICEVSKASTEIMLNRVCNGKEIDFPFS